MRSTLVGRFLGGTMACLFVAVSLMDCGPLEPVTGLQANGGSIAGAGNGGNGGRAGSAGASGGRSAIIPDFGGSMWTGPDAALDDAGTGQSMAAVWPPPGFVNVTDVTTGSYALDPNSMAAGDAGAAGAGSVTPTPATECAALFGVVRDFKMGSNPGGHVDFETAQVGDDLGIVTQTLGPDGKPVYAKTTGKTPSTHGKASFDQWYNDVPGVNMPFVLALHLVDLAGKATFSATKPAFFFPLDNQGFGNEGKTNNFSFTTEIHTSFTYNGGEIFEFCGDDDVFVYINKQLVINMGGRHAQECKQPSPAIDALGLTPKNVYEIAIFHAERHTDQSNFQIQTTLTFTNCGQVDGKIY